MKEQDKIVWKNDKTEINNLPDEEFKALVIKMLTEPGKSKAKPGESFNKELETIKRSQSKLDNSIAEIKNQTRSNEQQTK